MTMTPEQLAALRKVAEKYRRVREGFRNGKYERSDVRDARVELDAAFTPTTWSSIAGGSGAADKARGGS
jgi:hypothetical protein